MERLTKRELVELKNGKEIVACNYKDEECNDSCMYGRCRWNHKALKKLKEYEDLEEQGLLFRLPITEGTEVYVIYRTLTFGEVGDKADVCYRIERMNFKLSMCGDFGKTVFLTKEEAEAALKEMEKDNERT